MSKSSAPFFSILFTGLILCACQRDDDDDGAPVNAGFEPSVVVEWNEAMLSAIRNGPPRPTVIARSIFIVQSAMYDAWTAYTGNSMGTRIDPSLRRPPSERTMANKKEAVSYAAYRTLLDQFPAYETNSGTFTRLLENLGYDVDNSTDPSTPAGIGNIAAQTILDFRETDGSNAANNYQQITSSIYPDLYVPVNSADPESDRAPGGVNFDPNRWQPLRVPNGALLDDDGNPIVDDDDPSTYTDQDFLTPHWGAVMPFALMAYDQFRPQAPPQAGSSAPYTDALGNTMTNDEAYNQQVDEILGFSAELVDNEKVWAEYWADGPRSETPPGHWHALAHGISYRDQHTVDEDVKLYFALAGALFDASISIWDAKRTWDYIRPASAIRHKYFGETIDAWGGPDQGTIEIQGEDWRPYQALTFVTPPFAEYGSGHSGFSAAAAEILTQFTGSDAFYDGTTVLKGTDFNSDGIDDLLGEHIVPVGGNNFEGSPSDIIELRWTTLQSAADEAGISRRYGGIHFQDADEFSRSIGTQIGAQAFARAEFLWNGN